MANKYKAKSRLAQRAMKRATMCTNKAQYETEAEAFQKGQRSYQCPLCKKWHRSGQFATLQSICHRKAS